MRIEPISPVHYHRSDQESSQQRSDRESKQQYPFLKLPYPKLGTENIEPVAGFLTSNLLECNSRGRILDILA